MKTNKGFTLVEAMVVVGILAVTMAFGVPSFGTWKRKHNVETQVNRLNNDLQYARMQAYTNKVVTGMAWSGSTFSSYTIKRDATGDGDIEDAGDTISDTVNLTFSVTPVPTATSIAFDGRGFYTNANASVLRIASSGEAAVDCLYITSTRIIAGKWNGSLSPPKCVSK